MRLRPALEGRRGIYPQHPGLTFPRVFPTMGRGALEVKTVSRLQPVFFIFQRDLEFAPQHMQKLFAFMSVGFTTARLRSYTEQMWLHYPIALGQQFHSHACTCF